MAELGSEQATGKIIIFEKLGTECIGVCVCCVCVCVCVCMHASVCMLFLGGEDRERVSIKEGSHKSGTASNMLQCDLNML